MIAFRCINNKWRCLMNDFKSLGEHSYYIRQTFSRNVLYNFRTTDYIMARYSHGKMYFMQSCERLIFILLDDQINNY